ncbi:MAG: hypothetical protein ACERKV_12495 [Clostridiaceae bacterium]
MSKLKLMTKKEKKEHIWYYYKYHIIFGILALMFVGVLIKDTINTKNYLYNITVITSVESQEKLDDFQGELTEYILGEKDGKDQIGVDKYNPSLNSESQYELSPTENEAFMVRFGSSAIDLILIKKNMFDGLVSNDAMLNLNDIDGFNIEDYENKGYEKIDNYGIDISSSKKLKEIGLDTNDLVLCVSSNSEHSQYTLDLIKYILN